MAEFIIQRHTQDLELEEIIIKQLLNHTKYIHSYTETTLEEQYALQNVIPIGTIDFVTKWLNLVHNIEQMNPIEIPKYLRADEFLKRDYSIVKADEIPKYGNYFIKDVSELKKFSYCGELSYVITDEIWNNTKDMFNTSLKLNDRHEFLVSEIYDIQSEYRVYVISGSIEAIINYDGDCTILPDISMIKKIIGIINYNEKWLKSYTLDVMVGNRGTALIEIHNFVSVGLYTTLWGDNLLYAYRDGIDYILNDNKILER